MQVEVAQPRQVNHPLWNDAAIAHDDDGVGVKHSKLVSELVIVLDLLRLNNRQGQFQRRLFDRGKSELKPAPARLVGLRSHKTNRKTGFYQLLQRRDSEARRATEHQVHGLRAALPNCRELSIRSG